MQNNKSNLLLKLIFLGFTLFYLFTLIPLRIFPFIDIPFHLAEAAIYKHINDPGNQFNQFFEVNAWLKPNVFHYWFCSLPVFSSVLTGNKIYYGLYLVLFPCTSLMIVREINGNKWVALLSFLFVFNLSLMWGFSGFTLAIPFILLIFLLLIKKAKRDSVLLSIAIGIIFILIFFMHALATLFGIALFVVSIMTIYWGNWRKIFLNLVPVIPVLFLIGFWWVNRGNSSEQSTFQFLIDYYTKEYFQRISLRKRIFYFDNQFLFAEGIKKAIPLFFTAFVMGACFIAFITSKKSAKYLFHDKVFNLLFAFLALTFLCTFFLPPRLPDQRFLFERFSVFFLLSFVFLCSYFWKPSNSLIIPLVIVPVIALHAFLWHNYFTKFKKDSEAFTESILPSQEEDIVLGGIIYDQDFRGQRIYTHFPNYYIVWKQGIATTSLVDFRFGTVRRKVGKQILPEYNDLVEIKDYDGRFDELPYILIRGEIPQKDGMKLESFEVAKSSGKWKLLRNKNFENKN